MRRRAKPESGAPEADARTVRGAALAQLARRDFACGELRERLLGRGYPALHVDTVLGELQAEHLLSDSRYVEHALQRLAGRGHGPIRVRVELRQRGLEVELIDTALAEAGVDWSQLALDVRRRRFGAAVPRDARERAKQARFLQYRGFSSEQIRAALGRATDSGDDAD